MPQQEFKFNVIKEPGRLDPEEQRRLIDALVEVSAMATWDGHDQYEPAKQLWSQHFQKPGGQLEDLDRIVTVEDSDGAVVSYCASREFEVAGSPLIYFKLAMTVPQHQDKNVTGFAWMNLVDEERLRHMIPGFIFARTPNPIVYHGAKKLLKARAQQLNFGARFYPDIVSSHEIVAVPERIQEIVKDVLQLISPGADFDPQTFVQRRCMHEYSGVFKKSRSFGCRNAAVNDFFEKHVSLEEMDSVVLLMELYSLDSDAPADREHNSAT